MQASHTGQKADAARDSPSHHSVNSSESSLGFRSEKPPVEHSEKVVTSPPPGAQRRGLWRRIWDRLSGSKDKACSGPKRSPPSQDQPGKNHGSSTPVPRHQEWAKVENSSTVQRGLIPRPHGFKYAAERCYCPVEHVTLKSIGSAPWFIHTTLFSHTVADVVCAPPRWPEHLHQCWYDKIYVKNHPMVAHQRSYGRSIFLAHWSADGLYDWAVKFAIWHKDAKQLAALTYSDLRDMLLRRSLIKTAGLKFESDDPLELAGLVYLHLPKPGRYKPWYPNMKGDGVPSEDALRAELHVNEPTTWQEFDRHHSGSGDWSL